MIWGEQTTSTWSSTKASYKYFVYEGLTCNHRCVNQGGGGGGRGNNVQFMATNDYVLFPREIAWQLSLIAAFHSS